jgi:aminotransferase
MTEISRFGFANDVEFAKHLVKEIGVAAIPGSSFYQDPRDGKNLLRFCFSKKDETILEAERRLQRLPHTQ